MPLYEYQCGACGTEFEIISHSFDLDSALCPECKGISRRKMATFNFSVGWRMTERSHNRFGPKEEVERDT